jgi:hypothetical protein
MTSSEIKALLVEMPKWLVDERSVHAAVNEENARIKSERVTKAAAK